LMLMFVGVITLSSWRLFGRDETQGSGDITRSPDGSCTEKGTQDSYFFGIKFGSHDMVRNVNCDGSGPLSGWTEESSGPGAITLD
jgi:hypothetical protein